MHVPEAFGARQNWPSHIWPAGHVLALEQRSSQSENAGA